jgi:hypothetical protein
MASRRVLPSLCLRSRYARAGACTRPWVTAIRWRAQLSWRLPPRSRRWRWCLPEDRDDLGRRVRFVRSRLHDEGCGGNRRAVGRSEHERVLTVLTELADSERLWAYRYWTAGRTATGRRA